MSLSNEVGELIDMDTAFEFPIYAPIGNEAVMLEDVYIIPGADIALDATNYTTLEVVDKGIDGTGTTVLCTLHTEDIAGGVALSKHVAQSLQLAAPIQVSNAITLKKTDAAAAVDIQETQVIVKVRHVG